MEEEADKLLDQEQVKREAIQAVEQDGIVFLDEIDKISVREDRGGADVSREGVQRDLLPLIEAPASPPNMVPSVPSTSCSSLRRFSSKQALGSLAGTAGSASYSCGTQSAYAGRSVARILVEPEASLIKQYTALLATEGVTIDFTEDGITEIARLAGEINEKVENIGARRLHTVMERLVEDISFEATDREGIPSPSILPMCRTRSVSWSKAPTSRSSFSDRLTCRSPPAETDVRPTCNQD